MSGESREFSAKTVDAAISEGLRQLGVRDDVEVEVLHEGSRGLLGIGSTNARVRLTPKTISSAKEKIASGMEQVLEEVAMHTSVPVSEEDDEDDDLIAAEDPTIEAEQDDIGESTPLALPAETPTLEAVAAQPAKGFSGARETFDEEEGKAFDVDVNREELAKLASEMLGELLEHMGYPADIEVSWLEDDGENSPLNLNVVGGNLGMLIGRHGETLASIQYMIRLMVNQRIHRWTNIVVDVDGYKERRSEQLSQMAHRMADQVAQTGRGVALEPMPANERRLVHIALRTHPRVYTESIGEADRRKVQILPK